MIKEELNKIKTDNYELKKFGLLIGIIFLLLSFIKSFFLILSLALMLPALIRPRLLKEIYLFWMLLSLILGIISTNIILLFTYVFLFIPISYILKINKKDILNNKNKSKNSYWFEVKKSVSSYEKQY